MKKITFVISSNGYGHSKRSVQLLNEIYAWNNEIKFSVVCKKEKIDYIKNKINRINNSISFHTDLMENEPAWLTHSSLEFSVYLKWVEKFRSHPEILESDLVLSDNYVAPLLGENKVIMMGSFLWADIIEDYHKQGKLISKFENETLKKYRPKMIVLESMYMTSLKEKVVPIETSWFCSRKPAQNKSTTGKILISAGGTEQLDDIFINIIDDLLTNSSSNLFYLDSKLYRKYKKLNQPNSKVIHEFDFTENGFHSIDAIVCRPGIGILTECVQYTIPPIVVYDNSNKEIINNAKRVSYHEFGFDVFIENDRLKSAQLEQIVKTINSKEQIKLFRENILKQKTNGHKEVAQKIINELTV